MNETNRQYFDTNCGPNMVYDTPDEKEIARLEKRNAKLATEAERLRTVETVLIELEEHLPNVLQLIHGLRQKLPASAWTEWDQSVRDKLSEHISKRGEWSAARAILPAEGEKS